MKLFIASHGHLASGFESSLRILCGQAENFTVYDAYLDESTLPDALDAFFADVPESEEVLLLSDLYGGSVNTAMVPWLKRPHTRLVAGVNLALVLELAVRKSLDDRELKDLIEQARAAMVLVEVDDSPVIQEEFF